MLISTADVIKIVKEFNDLYWYLYEQPSMLPVSPYCTGPIGTAAMLSTYADMKENARPT